MDRYRTNRMADYGRDFGGARRFRGRGAGYDDLYREMSPVARRRNRVAQAYSNPAFEPGFDFDAIGERAARGAHAPTGARYAAGGYGIDYAGPDRGWYGMDRDRGMNPGFLRRRDRGRYAADYSGAEPTRGQRGRGYRYGGYHPEHYREEW